MDLRFSGIMPQYYQIMWYFCSDLISIPVLSEKWMHLNDLLGITKLTV